jgi:DNA-binding CsgD family transcriptional regulator
VSQQIEAALADSARSASGVSGVGQVVFAPFANGRPAFAHVLPTCSGHARSRIDPRAAAIVFITPSNQPSGLPLHAWAAAFGLTAAELRVLELMVDGHTIAEAATRLGIAETTGRTHLARVMEKTGTTRQADLIRLAMQLTSPVRKPGP